MFPSKSWATAVSETTPSGSDLVSSVSRHGECGHSPCLLTLDTRSLPDGVVSLTAVAQDFEGNISLPATLQLVVDNTAPIVHVPASLEATATSAQGARIDYAASAQDAHDGSVPVVCT